MVETSPRDTASPFTPLSNAEIQRLWPLAAHARYLYERLQYVDYAQAEQDAAVLAGKLAAQMSVSELDQAAFLGIPRGGLLVLGWLAYYLDLHPDQLLPSAVSSGGSLVVVDDCALTGQRLLETTSLLNNDRITIALLYAAPGMQDAIREKSPQVQACVAANILRTKAASTDEFAETIQMQELLSERPTTEPVEEIIVFPWNEPSLLVLFPGESVPEQNWRFIAPHKCLKNRQALGLEPRPQVRLDWFVPEGIVYGWFDNSLFLLDSREGKVFRLDDFAADCWRSAAGYGSEETALAFLNNRTAASDLEDRFLANLRQFEDCDLIRHT